jgi:hypothetical protein
MMRLVEDTASYIEQILEFFLKKNFFSFIAVPVERRVVYFDDRTIRDLL